jgi:hypothetical protein
MRRSGCCRPSDRLAGWDSHPLEIADFHGVVSCWGLRFDDVEEMAPSKGSTLRPNPDKPKFLIIVRLRNRRCSAGG